LQERRRQQRHGIDDLRGAPTGTAAALTALLTGKAAPHFNECGSE